MKDHKYKLLFFLSILIFNITASNLFAFNPDIADDNFIDSQDLQQLTLHWLDSCNDTALDSKAFIIPKNGDSGTYSLDQTTNLDHSIPVADVNSVTINFKTRFNELTTAGRDTFRLGIFDTSLTQYYRIGLRHDTDLAPFRIASSAGGETNVGNIGDQDTSSLWQISVTFNRLSDTSTKISYQITKNGKLYAQGNDYWQNALPSNTTLDTAAFQIWQRGPSTIDDLNIYTPQQTCLTETFETASTQSFDHTAGTLIADNTWTIDATYLTVDINTLTNNYCDGTDLNADGKVNFRDFAILAKYWKRIYFDIPVLQHPADNNTIYVTIPYFTWSNEGKKPWPGNYQIQIDDNNDFSSPVDDDTIPAFLNYYSPDFELTEGQKYYWRLRYIYDDNLPGQWTAENSFTIGIPYVIDVSTTDGWNEIQAKFAQVADYGNTHVQAAQLRFPVGHHFALTQDPADDYLLYQPNKDNFIINGRGSTIKIRATIPTVPPRCGFLQLTGQNHIQLKDIIIDYENDSLCQFAGVISNFNKTNQTFTVTVDPNIYNNFAEAADTNYGYALDASNQQNILKQGAGFSTLETWAQADQGNNTFNFTGSTGFGYVKDALANGDYFVSSPVPDRGGDIITLISSVTDFVANNVTTLACRGRFYAAGNAGDLYARCINCNFLRSAGRIMGSSSGGVNHTAGYAWYENNTFEYTRDDAIHIGGGEAADPLASNLAFRNNTVTGAFRNSCWVHTDRSWITGNTIKYAGSVGMNISGQSSTASECRMMDVGLIENNLIIHPAWHGIMTRTTLNQSTCDPDPVTGYYSRYLTIVNNTIVNHQKDQAIFLTYLKDSTVSNNIVDSNSPDWSVYSDPDLEIGIYSANSINVQGSENIVNDTRIEPYNWLVIDSNTCTDINISVLP